MNYLLKQDVRNQVGSIYKLNAPSAIGYLFTIRADDPGQIAQGMFCSNIDEIDPKRWDGFAHIHKTYIEFYDLNCPRSVSILRNKLHVR